MNQGLKIGWDWAGVKHFKVILLNAAAFYSVHHWNQKQHV